MIRFVSAASIAAVALVAAPSAFAKPITTVEHFTTGKHTKVVERVTVHTRTGVIDTHTKITKEDGKTKTIARKETPAAAGYTVSRTVTGFDGVSRTSTGHAGGHGKA